MVLDEGDQALEHVVDVAGEDNVGIGTDFTQDQDQHQAFFDWVAHDKGTARRILVRRGEGLPRMPKSFERLADFGNLTAAMEGRGWREPRIRKIMGENWLSLFKDVWGA